MFLQHCHIAFNEMIAGIGIQCCAFIQLVWSTGWTILPMFSQGTHRPSWAWEDLALFPHVVAFWPLWGISPQPSTGQCQWVENNPISVEYFLKTCTWSGHSQDCQCGFLSDCCIRSTRWLTRRLAGSGTAIGVMKLYDKSDSLMFGVAQAGDLSVVEITWILAFKVNIQHHSTTVSIGIGILRPCERLQYLYCLWMWILRYLWNHMHLRHQTWSLMGPTCFGHGNKVNAKLQVH